MAKNTDPFGYQKKLKKKIWAINARIAKGETLYFDLYENDKKFIVKNAEYTDDWGGEAFINTTDGKRFNVGSTIFTLF